MTTLRLAAACALVALVGCAHERPRPKVETTSARMNQRPVGQVNVSDEIRGACRIEDLERSPNFTTDSASLSEADRAILVQVARCFTTGPLKGRAIQFVGHADPRGESEYNMGLGALRAEEVDYYLTALGVDPRKMSKTSRGEIDAMGIDEDGWQLDRRVDLRLEGPIKLTELVPSR